MSRTAVQNCRTDRPTVPDLSFASESCRQQFTVTLLRIVVVSYMLYAPLSVRASLYLFPQIAEAWKTNSVNEEFGLPAMNADGRVAFHVSGGDFGPGGGNEAIVTGGAFATLGPLGEHFSQQYANYNNAQTLLIVNDQTSFLGYPFVELGKFPSINDWGDVAYQAMDQIANTTINKRTYHLNFANDTHEIIAQGVPGDLSNTFQQVLGGSIDNNGAVAFSGIHGSPSAGYTISTAWGVLELLGDPIHILETETLASGSWLLGPPMVKPGLLGNVFNIEMVRMSEIASDPTLLSRVTKLGYTFTNGGGGGGTLPEDWANHQITIAEGELVSPTAPEFAVLTDSGGPSINNGGTVSFTAVPTLGGDEGVYTGIGGGGIGGVPNLLADTSGEYSNFQSTAISNAGVAFGAELDVGGHGIFTGPDAFNEKVLAVGDTIPGYPSTVESVQIGRQAINDNGQIAMLVHFADGTERILRADPFILAFIKETFYATGNIFFPGAIELGADASCSMSQAISIPGGTEDLSFDYFFPATTGQLTVTLEGEILAQIAAPDVLADGLTTFQMPVDISGLFSGPLDAALLEFSLSGGRDPAGLILDNILFSTLENGDFGTGDLTGWQISFTDGGSVGVGVDPFSSTAVVPEPAAILLALLGLALLPRRRRR